MNNADCQIDVLVIGAGPSGCVAAAYLHHQGFKIKVVEKSKFPRFVIGESLLPRCMDHFEEAGLLDCLNQCDFEVKSGARFLKGDKTCHFDFSEKYTDGWNWTWQVPRADFDSVLANELEKKGVEICFEHEVTNVTFEDNGLSKTSIKNKKGDISIIHARFIIDSSGYGRVLPRLLQLEKPSTIPEHASIFTHVKDLKRPNGREGTLITFDVLDNDTWFWVIPFSNGVTSIGFVGKIDFIESFNDNLKEMLKLSNHYFERFEGSDFLFEPICIKNYSKSVTQLYGNGYALTGNSAEFLDPVFSSGVTFATESALLSAKLVTKMFHGEPVNWESEYSNYMKYGINVFATYVKEWYTGRLQNIFFNPFTNPEIKRQICSVLAGYVWDKTNPFVKNHDRLVKTLAEFIAIENNKNTVH